MSTDLDPLSTQATNPMTSPAAGDNTMPERAEGAGGKNPTKPTDQAAATSASKRQSSVDASTTAATSTEPTAITRPPPALVPSSRTQALGLDLAPLSFPGSLRPPSTPSTPGIPAPGTPATPYTPGTPAAGELSASPSFPSRPTSVRALSLSLARRASAASLVSEDGIDVSKLDLRPVFTPPPGSVPLPPLPGQAHPLPPLASPGLGPAAAIHSHHHQHHRRTSTASSNGCASNGNGHTHSHSLSHSHSQTFSTSPSSSTSVHASPLIAPASPASPAMVANIPFGPTVAETGLYLAPDSSHSTGQLERKSPRPRPVRLDSFGGEGLEYKPSARKGSESDLEVESIPEGVVKD